MAAKHITSIDLNVSYYHHSRKIGWWGFIHRAHKGAATDTETHRYYNEIRPGNVRRMRAIQDALQKRRATA